SGRMPDFEAIDDKLAAHKVISVVLTIKIPENFELWVDSALASVWANGTFNFINCNLTGGDCRLKNFRGSGIVNTITGNIYVNTFDSEIVAHSRNGNLTIDNMAGATNNLKLTSIDGDISVTQSK
ncbi:MAG: hypothetical protein V7767_12240, partial [Leeuwenhoekiella sp.]